MGRRLDAENAYIVQDAAGVLPIAAQDLVYARFLLTHFADPRAAISAWSDILAPHGRLLIQEPALLDSEHPILTRYYELLAELHRAHGQALYVGRQLDRCVDDSVYALVHFGRRDFDLPAPKMARLHAPNLPHWRTDSLARALFDPRELDDLENELGAIARSDAGVVHYGLGELVLDRR